MSTATGSQELMPTAPGGALGPAAGPPVAVTGSGAGTGGGGLEFGDILRLLRQRKWLILITFSILFALVIAGTFITRRYFPKYTATAILELQPPAEEAFQIRQRLVDPKQMELQVQTRAQAFRQLNLLQQVLALDEIKATQYYQSKETPEDFLYDLRDDLAAGAVRDTTLIRVALATRVPADAELIVDRIINQHLQRSSVDRSVALTQAMRAMRDTREQLSSQLDAKRQEISRFLQRADVPDLESQRQLITVNLADLQREMTLLNAEAADYETQLAAIGGRQPYELPVTKDMENQINADPLLRLRRSEVQDLELQRDTLLRSKTVGENHRQVAVLTARLNGLKDLERQRYEELLDQVRGSRVEFLQENLARVRAIQAELQERFAEDQARQRELDRSLLTYQTLVEDKVRLEEQLTVIENKINEAEHGAKEEENRQELVLRQPPEVAPNPTWPDLRLFLGGGFVLAAGLSIGLAFLLEFADQSIRTPIDVARNARHSVLGSIPELLDDDEVDVEDIARATRQAPHSLLAESYRQVRTNLLFSGPAESQQVLLITSPGAGDGKSSIAVNLAVVLAQGGQKVLLLDCNFRRPFIRETFENTRREGLSNTLIGQTNFENVVTPTEIQNLDVVSSGPLPPTPAELLGTPAMQNLLNDARQKYDRIIIDGPPVLLMSDAMVLAVQVDGIILVTRAGENRRGELRRASDQLHRIGARIVGAILNGVKARAGGYFRRQYREFYDYVSDETVAAGVDTMTPALTGSDNDRGASEDHDKS